MCACIEDLWMTYNMEANTWLLLSPGVAVHVGCGMSWPIGSIRLLVMQCHALICCTILAFYGSGEHHTTVSNPMTNVSVMGPQLLATMGSQGSLA